MQRLKTFNSGLRALVLAVAFPALAGEPLLTDDPGTPGPNNWELNVALAMVELQEGTAWELPVASLGYGVGERIEIGITVPFVVVDNAGEGAKGGLGNVSVGGKWRFLDEAANGISVSTAPAVTFDSLQRSADNGIVDSGFAFTLPVEVGRTVGPVDFYAEVGWDFIELGTDLWFLGVAAEWGFCERWTLLGEVYGQSTCNFDDGELLLNGGLRFALRENLFLHGAAGVPLRQADSDPTRFIAFLGVQWWL
jgi:hypothetical protein